MSKENSAKNSSIFTKYRGKAVRGSNIEEAARDVANMRKQEQVNQDTQHRLAIQSCIHKLISEGNEFAALLNELNKKFPDSKYEEYFSNWIMDKLEKSKRSNNKGREI